MDMKMMKKMHERMKGMYEKMTSREMSKDTISKGMRDMKNLYSDMYTNKYAEADMDDPEMMKMNKDMMKMHEKMIGVMKKTTGTKVPMDMQGMKEVMKSYNQCFKVNTEKKESVQEDVYGRMGKQMKGMGMQMSGANLGNMDDMTMKKIAMMMGKGMSFFEDDDMDMDDMDEADMKMMKKMKDMDEADYDSMDDKEKERMKEAMSGMMKKMKSSMKENGDMDGDDEIDDDDEVDEKKMSAADKMKQKKYRKSSAGKKALKKHMKKSSKAGYKPDPKRSKSASKAAKMRKEAFEIYITNFLSDAKGSFFEDEENQKILKQFAINIQEHVDEVFINDAFELAESEYETYIEEKVLPTIVGSVTEDIEDYVENIAMSWMDEKSEELALDEHAKHCVKFVGELKESWTSNMRELPETPSVVEDYEDKLSKAQEEIASLKESVTEAKTKLYIKEKEDMESELFSDLTESQKEVAKEALDSLHCNTLEDFENKAKLIKTLAAKKVEEKVKEKDETPAQKPKPESKKTPEKITESTENSELILIY